MATAIDVLKYHSKFWCKLLSDDQNSDESSCWVLRRIRGAETHRAHSTLKTVLGSSVLIFGMLTRASILTGLREPELIIMRGGHDYPVARGG